MIDSKTLILVHYELTYISVIVSLPAVLQAYF